MSARYSLKRRVANAAVMAVMGCLAIGASESSSPRAATNSSDLDALAAQVNGTTAATSTVLYRQYVGRLTSVQTSLAECRKFLGKYGDNDRVAAIIRRATANPGDQLFTEPEIIDQLKRAVGTNISLTQLDLETCLQAQDRNLGGRPGDTLLERVGAVSASLNRCLASLEATGPNAAGLAILERVSRRPADDTFTSARTLARLEGAVGELRLSPRDLETCVDAFDQNAAFEQTFKVGDYPPPCSSGETLCQINIVSETCCSPGEVCSTVCGGRDGCSGYCHSPGCFPADATVMTDAGIAKAMTDVRLGDRVLAARPDGTLGYEEVYLNTHRDAVSSAPYVALRLASGRELRLSPRHFIPVAASAGDAWSSRVTKGGDEIRVGDFMLGPVSSFGSPSPSHPLPAATIPTSADTTANQPPSLRFFMVHSPQWPPALRCPPPQQPSYHREFNPFSAARRPAPRHAPSQADTNVRPPRLSACAWEGGCRRGSARW